MIDWIPVGDRLPKPEQVVLVYTSHGIVEMAAMVEYDDALEWGGMSGNDITHWAEITYPQLWRTLGSDDATAQPLQL